MKRLDHPNIVKLYEMFEDEKRFYLSMELCQAGELFDELQKNTSFEEDVCSNYTRQILQAVSYCHNKNVVHRDINPQNILIDSKKNSIIKLKDFSAS